MPVAGETENHQLSPVGQQRGGNQLPDMTLTDITIQKMEVE